MPNKTIICRLLKVDTAYIVMKNGISRVFYRYGMLVGSYPKIFSLVPLFVSLGLSLGILNLKERSDAERLFTPVGSRIFKDRTRMKELFPDSTSWNFDLFGLNDVPTVATLLFRRGGVDVATAYKLTLANVSIDQVKYNIFDPGPLAEIQRIVARLKAIQVSRGGRNYKLADLCARVFGSCVKDGEQFTTDAFAKQVRDLEVRYPLHMTSTGPLDLSFYMAGVNTTTSGKLRAARVLKIRFFWSVETVEFAKEWNKQFLKEARELAKNLKYDLLMSYSTSESLKAELRSSTQADVVYFTLTLILLVVYSVLVSTGGDMVSTRALLACGGVLAAGLGIISSMGLLCLIGEEYVGFVGLMPYLVLGIGVDDMFLLMSAWGESMHHQTSVPQRVGLTFSKAGMSITITTLTDFLAFIIGISSTFIAVRQFCLFTALAVLFCYLCSCTLFGACMSLHGERVYAGKHCLTWRPVKSRLQYREEGANFCKVFCCGGSVPSTTFQDESICEQLPRFLLPRIILNPVCKVLLLTVSLVLIAFAVYGAINLKPGMKYADLVLRSSYYYEYSTLEDTYFGQRLAIAFVVDQEVDYAAEEGDMFRQLLNTVQRDPSINSTFVRCWLHRFSRSPFYPSQPLNTTFFIERLRLFLQYNKVFMNDIHFNANKTAIDASRCYVLTVNEVSIFKQSEMMVRMRNVADNLTQFSVFAFQPVFVMLEHTIAIWPSTLQTIGTAVAVMFLVTLVMLPQLLMVCLVTLNVTAIITCVFGFMYYMEISFSGMSMIHILMSVGFSVDYSAHICAAYLMSNQPLRHQRAQYALVHASGPIFNGGMSSLVGVSMLLLSESYFFRTFFKITSLVISIGAFNSVFFMPIILSYIGPENKDGVCEEQSFGHTVVTTTTFTPDRGATTKPSPGDSCVQGTVLDDRNGNHTIRPYHAWDSISCPQTALSVSNGQSLEPNSIASVLSPAESLSRKENVTTARGQYLSAGTWRRGNINPNNAILNALSINGALASTQRYAERYLESLETLDIASVGSRFPAIRQGAGFEGRAGDSSRIANGSAAPFQIDPNNTHTDSGSHNSVPRSTECSVYHIPGGLYRDTRLQCPSSLDADSSQSVCCIRRTSSKMSLPTLTTLTTPSHNHTQATCTSQSAVPRTAARQGASKTGDRVKEADSKTKPPAMSLTDLSLRKGLGASQAYVQAAVKELPLPQSF